MPKASAEIIGAEWKAHEGTNQPYIWLQLKAVIYVGIPYPNGKLFGELEESVRARIPENTDLERLVGRKVNVDVDTERGESHFDILRIKGIHAPSPDADL